MSATLALVGEVVLAAGDDLAPSNSGGVNLNLTLWSGVASFITPPIVAVINQSRWAPFVRLLVTALFCLGMAAATVALEGQLNATRLATSVLLILSGAVFFYQTAWKTIAPRIEAATSTGGQPAIAEQ